MIKTCLLVVFCTIATICYSQQKVTKYFQVTLLLKSDLSSIRTAHISLGDSPALFTLKDSSEIKQLQMATTLSTETDVLNYLSQLGWQPVSVGNGASVWVVMYFKKEFDKSQLSNP